MCVFQGEEEKEEERGGGETERRRRKKGSYASFTDAYMFVRAGVLALPSNRAQCEAVP